MKSEDIFKFMIEAAIRLRIVMLENKFEDFNSVENYC